MNKLAPTRRQLLQTLAAAGVGSVVFQRALAADVVQVSTVTPDMVRQAEWIAGITLTDGERADIAKSLTQSLRGYKALHDVTVPYDVPPALVFDPAPDLLPSTGPIRRGAEPISAADSEQARVRR